MNNDMNNTYYIVRHVASIAGLSHYNVQNRENGARDTVSSVTGPCGAVRKLLHLPVNDPTVELCGDPRGGAVIVVHRQAEAPSSYLTDETLDVLADEIAAGC